MLFILPLTAASAVALNEHRKFCFCTVLQLNVWIWWWYFICLEAQAL